MTKPFDYFVLFAEMRTGSNFLESNLNAFPGLTCHGEAFNPHFIGYPNSTDILGVSLAQREQDPISLVEAVKHKTDGLGGFRYFHDHDPRVLDTFMNDPRCAKIVLTRNPVDSYVSWKIAKSTGQWKLTNVNKRKDGKAHFEKAEFEDHLEGLQQFQIKLLNTLQKGAQTAFYVAYEDLQDVEIMNGLARWLGQADQLEGLESNLKRQNPAPLSEKVENFGHMQDSLAHLDQFNLARTPNFEPRRGPSVPNYIAAAKAPLLFLPIQSSADTVIQEWLAGLDGVGAENLVSGFSQKTLRQWKRKNPGFRSFTVVRHPVQRAHQAFCDRILSTGPRSFPKIRQALIRQRNLPLPDKVDDAYGPDQHRTAFLGYLEWVKTNLAGQTGVRIDPNWASQAQILQGFADLATPDLVLRETELNRYLPFIAEGMGYENPKAPARSDLSGPVNLKDIYDAEVEAMVSSIYQKDYVTFGFDRWT